jgi:WD40 repeat protein
VLELPSHRVLAEVPHTSGYKLRQLYGFSGSGDRLAVLQEQQVEVLELAPDGGAPKVLMTVPDLVPPVALTPDGAALLAPEGVAGHPSTLRLWRIADRQPLWTTDLLVESAAFSADGTQLAVGGDAWVAMLDARTGVEAKRWTLPAGGGVYRVALSRDARTLVACAEGGVWRLDVPVGQLTRLGADCSGMSAAISADGQFIAASGSTVSLWRGDSATPVLQFPEEGSPLFVALSADGAELYHSGTLVQRLALPLGASPAPPEEELAEVLRTYRLAFDGRTVVPAPRGW